MNNFFTAAACSTLIMALSACQPQPVDYTVEATPYRDNKDCAISFTYDDGMLCHYTDIAPELEKRGFRGTFWIIGANMDKNDPGYPWMTWEQVAELSRRGHEMSNHTWTHPNLPQLSLEEVRKELAQCDDMLEAKTGKRPITMAYPYNAMSPEVVALCEENRVGTRTFQDGHGQVESHCTPESLKAWLEQQIADRNWGVTMTHGTTYGWDLWNDPQVLYNFYDEVKAVEDKVWVGTFAEVAAYIAEQAQVKVFAIGTTEACHITCENPLDLTLYHEPLTLCIKGLIKDGEQISQQEWSGKQITARQGDVIRNVVNADSCLYVEYLPNGIQLDITWE